MDTEKVKSIIDAWEKYKNYIISLKERELNEKEKELDKSMQKLKQLCDI